MSIPEQMLDKFIADQEAKGHQRLKILRTEDSTSISPEEVPWAENPSKFIKKQQEAFSPNLIEYYLELLSRSTKLTQFIKDNVGCTDDYPIYLDGDSYTAEQEFLHLASELESIAGCLAEV